MPPAGDRATGAMVSLPEPHVLDFQIADFVELNCLETWVGNRQRFAGDDVTHLELVFGVGAFPPRQRGILGPHCQRCRAL